MKATLKATGEQLDVDLVKEVCYVDQNGDIYFEDDLEIEVEVKTKNGREKFLAVKEYETNSCKGCCLHDIECHFACDKVNKEFCFSVILKRK